MRIEKRILIQIEDVDFVLTIEEALSMYEGLRAALDIKETVFIPSSLYPPVFGPPPPYVPYSDTV